MAVTTEPVTSTQFNSKPMAGKGVRESYVLDVPDPSTATIARRVHHLFAQARDAKRERVAQWKRNAEVMANRTWLEGRPRWMPAPEVNEIYPILATIVGWVTDSRPTFDAVPFCAQNSPQYDWWSELADDLVTVVSASYIANNDEREMERIVWDAYANGTGISKTTWDQSQDGGLGNVEFCRVNPYNFYPDPNATDFDDAQYLIEVRVMSLQELDRRYPGAARGYAENSQLSISGIDREPDDRRNNPSYPMANPGVLVPGQPAPAYGLPGQTSRGTVDPVEGEPVVVMECWIREHSHSPNPDPDATFPTATREEWRCLVVAGNQVLLDATATELFGHNWHPYDRFVQHEVGKLWGMSMVELLTPSQLAINRALAAIQQNLELVGNPILKDNLRANLTRKPVSNRPGSRLTVGDGGDVEWLSPPPIHPLHMDLIQFHISEMERISGLSAISRGVAPAGRNSADVMSSIQESSFVRIRLALRNIEYGLRSAFTKYAQLIVRNYTAARMVAIVGPSGERSSLALKSRHFHVQTENGAVPLRFQLNVNAGSQLPISPSAMAEKANFLFQAGAIDEIALLQAHRWPHYEQVYQRVMAQRQAMLTAAPPKG